MPPLPLNLDQISAARATLSEQRRTQRATSAELQRAKTELDALRRGGAMPRLIRRAEPPGVHVPIIALTASATAGEQERCLAAGMTGFLSKPVGVEALGRVLREQLSGAHATAPQQIAEVPVPPSLAPVEDTAARRAPSPTLDPTRLEELAEMGAAAFPLIQRAIDNFVGSIGESLDGIRAEVAAGDAAALRTLAHRLKGSAANLGARRVAEVALGLEHLGDSHCLDGAAELVDLLAAALAEAAVELADYRLEDRGLGRASA